jgi:hypothetical protein
MIIADICLSDIPAENRTQGKNGKWYTKVVVDERKQPDQYGNTHSVYMNQTKEQREAKETKVYVGNGKELVFGGAAKKPDYEQLPDQKSSDGLPF